MEVLQEIQKIFSKEFSKSCVSNATHIDNSKNFSLCLKDVQKVIIENVSENSISIKLDDNKLTFPKMLSQGFQNRCDYVLLTKEEKYNKKIALFIELKSKRVKKNAIQRQLQGGLALFDYFYSILQYFSYPDRLEEFEKFFILFYEGSTQKQKFDKNKIEKSKEDVIPGSKFLKFPISSTNNTIPIEKIFKICKAKHQ